MKVQLGWMETDLTNPYPWRKTFHLERPTGYYDHDNPTEIQRVMVIEIEEEE